MGIGVKYDDGSGSLKPLASYKGMRSPWGSDIHSMHGTRPIKSFGGGKSLIEKLRQRREAADPKVAAKDLDKIDPRNGGMTVGDAHSAHPSDADATHRDAKSHEPWARSFMSGIHFEKEAPTGRTIVWGYLRSDRFTGEGRAFETTGETKVPVYSFFEGGGEANPSPFDIEEDEDGTRKIVRCTFYWGKERIDLSDFDLLEGAEAVYLVGEKDDEGELQFSLATDESETGGAVSYQIYAFTDGEVSCDYRTTFLTLGCVTKSAEGSGLVVNGDEIDIAGREEDDTFGIRTITVKTGDGDDKTVKFLGTEDVEIETNKKTECVESLNGETGALEITGGHKVNVSKDGKTIVVSLDESKEDPKPDPNTNCGDHPGSEEGGGVIVEPAGGGGSGAGVPAEGGAGTSGVGCDCD